MDEQIIIDVKLSDADFVKQAANVKRQIDELKQANKDLQKQVKDGTITDEEAAKQMERNNAQIKNLQATYNSYSKSVQGLNIDNEKLGDSLNEMRLRLRNLQSQYAALTKEQRDNEGIGGVLLKSIQSLDDEVKSTEATMGDFRRNVGNYPTLLDNLVPGFSKVTGAVDKLGISFSGGLVQGLKSAGTAVTTFGKMLLTTPVGWIAAGLAAVVAVLHKLSDAFKRNDEAGTAMQKLFASLQPITTAISKVFDGLATIIGKAANAIADFIARFSDGAKAAQAQVVSIDNLEEAERRYTINSAKRNEMISEMRAKASEKDKYTAAERKRFLEDANALELANYEDEKRIAEERLRTLKEQAREQVDTSDELANKIAEAEAKVHDTRRAYNDARRNLNKQIASVDAELTKQQESNAQKRAQIAAKEAEAQRKSIENIKKYAEQTQDALNGLIKEDEERQAAQEKTAFERKIAQLKSETLATAEEEQARNELIAALTVEHETKLQAIRDDAAAKRLAQDKAIADEEARLREEAHAKQLSEEAQARANANAQAALDYSKGLLDAREYAQQQVQAAQEYLDSIRRENYATQGEYDAALIAANKQFADALKDVQKSNNEYMSSVVGAAQAMQGLFSTVLDGMNEDSAEYAATQKAMAIFNIGVSLATSIAQITRVATQSSFTVWDYIANLAAGISSVTASIFSAKKVLSQTKTPKFADGGIVGGTSYTGDRVSARVNSGEMILTREQQAQLFDIAQGNRAPTGIDYKQMAAAMAQAVASQPAPIVAYKELTTFGEKVAQIKDLSKI